VSDYLNALAEEATREDLLAQITRLIEERDSTAAAHTARVAELLETNNREVERRRIAERALDASSFQQRVGHWMQACFGPAISADRLERGDRLLEEVLELLQSGDYPAERVAALAGYVWSRPAGVPAQEVGGVKVTLAAYCLAHEIDMHEAGETELARIWTKVEAIRAKQAAKPTGSALPMVWPHATAAQPVEAMRAALVTAIDHIKHMAAWITSKDAGYSFEALGEDMPGMEAALAALSAERSVIGKTLPETGNKLHQENGEATALTAPPASAAPPAIYVSAQQLDNAPNLPSRHLPFRLAPEGLFQTALFRAAQVAVPDGWALVPAMATREWATSYATWKFGQSATPRCESPGEIDIEWAATLIRNMLSVAPAPPPPTLPAEPEGEPLTFTYRNWRGEIAERRAIPRRVYFGATEWHPEPQWLLRALDVDKGAERDFALKDATFSAHPAAQQGMRVKGLEEIGKTPRGYTIFREVNEVGGHRYWSDEIGGGVCVWDTCLADAETLRECLQIEEGASPSPTAEEYQRGAGWMQSEAARLVREAQGAFGSVMLAEKIMSLPLTSGEG